MSLTIVAQHPPSEEQMQVLQKIMDKSGAEKEPLLLKTKRPFGFFLMQDDHLVGGIRGRVVLGCLEIYKLGVAQSLQHQGWGTKLLQVAEEYGKKNSCHFATLRTLEFQAKDFYLKNGYRIEFIQDGYTGNHFVYYLRKDLV